MQVRLKLEYDGTGYSGWQMQRGQDSIQGRLEDALARIFGAEVRVQTETHFELINRFGRDAGGKDLVQAFEGVVVTFEAADAFLHRETRFHGLIQRSDAAQRG